ncbi:MAG: hypothetical protein Ta2A_20810 [Treponemataceae bacterium]|nr:MAG: hypothetical protein Ta2A_20810 [Treponemataceae bacterium]
MISLEQIQTLEAKVETAISKINALTQENDSLKAQLEGYQQEKQQIAQIEQGILHALDRLGSVESTIHGLASASGGAESGENADFQQDMFAAPSETASDGQSPGNGDGELVEQAGGVNEPQQFDNIY